MRQYEFNALVVLDPTGREDAAQCDREGTQACFVVEPSYCAYFPAVISLGTGMPSQAKAHALVTIALYDSEAEVFFASGQRFTIWSDAVVDHSVQAVGLAGYGVISGCPPTTRRPFRATAAGKAASEKRQDPVPAS
jgi:hypothetical protein